MEWQKSSSVQGMDILILKALPLQCAKCGQSISRVGFLLRGHICKQMPKLGPAFTDGRTELWGRGLDWMPGSYAEYYAKYPAVYAAVKLRSDAMTVPPLKVYQRAKTGELKEIGPTEHPLAALLAKVNPFWTRGDLIRGTSIYLDLWGSAFWVLKKTGPDAIPSEIWLPRADHMAIVPDRDRYIAGYIYQAPGGQRIPLRIDEVVWLHTFNPLEPYAGISPIAPARASIDMGHEGILHNRNIFKNGMLFGNLVFMAKDDVGMTQDQAAEFRAALQERYSKPENSHIPLIMGNFDVKNLGLTNRDMEFTAALRWSLEDVARVFGVPKPLLGDLERATYENIDAAERIFWRSSMVPHIRFVEEQINEMLVPQFGEEGLLVKFDLSKIEALQEDSNAWAMRELAEVEHGALTINEYRNRRELDPVPWGDVVWLPFGLQPIEVPEDAQGQGPAMTALPSTQEEEKGAPPLASHRPAYQSLNSWKKFELETYRDTTIEKILAIHDRMLTKVEGDFQQMQRILFREQRIEVLRHVNSQRSGAPLTLKEFPVISLFSLSEWVRKFIQSGIPLYGVALSLGAAQQISAFNLPVVFDPSRIQKWMDMRTAFWAQRVNEETARLLMEELKEGLAAGESVHQMQNRVERIFEFSDVIRSERIARTETQAALNEGAVESYRQSGIVERKMWLATLDSRVRDTHLAAHRQIVELEADFLVGGEFISHPGEGSPENAINCRCTVAPLVNRRGGGVLVSRKQMSVIKMEKGEEVSENGHTKSISE